MTRCCICGRPLTADKSVARGIGPICWGKNNLAVIREVRNGERNALQNGNLDYFMGNNELTKNRDERIPLFDGLKLPCNDYDCVKGGCPWASFGTCPRERVYIKKDIYPLYKEKDRFCSFCGEKVGRNNYTKNVFKSKITIECQECRNRNHKWRRVKAHV